MHYFIGMPEWRHPGWYAHRPDSPLSVYAKHFNSIEGNSTFYALPSEKSVAAWRESVPAHFRFCFKFPRDISHEAQLRHCGADLRVFFDRLAPLADKMGILWLQMGPQFTPQHLPELARFLSQLPPDFRYGIEVRHDGFFRKDDTEARFNRLLADRGINRVMFDTRKLFAHPAHDDASREALKKKPRFPLHVLATGESPLVRFISPMDLTLAHQALAQWADKVCEWINEGRTPYLFFHTPDLLEAPQLARWFTTLLAERDPRLTPLSLWPLPPAQDSLSLF